MNAQTIATALGGHRSGSSWIARCPAHEDRKPSLSISETSDGKVLLHCFAGCDQKEVIEALRERGLWPESGAPRLLIRPTSGGRLCRAEGTIGALKIWEHSRPARGTPVETYLNSRRIQLPPPLRLRFYEDLKHRTGDRWPAMVALVTRGADDTPIGIHRTFLARDGSGKAPVEPQKMMLGPCRGGAVRLAAPADVLMIGEGVETCLAAMQATGHPAWAALSTSGLRTLELPTDVRKIVILADGDTPGESAARDAAWLWSRQGRRVWIARPTDAKDFNDMLTGLSPSIEGAAR